MKRKHQREEIKLKKALASVLAFTFVFGTAAAVPQGTFDIPAGIRASADSEEITEGSFKYVVDEEGARITKYIGEKKGASVEIPDTLGGNTVYAVGSEAFLKNKNIISVKIPDSVTHIYGDAFAECDALQTVEFGSGVKEIGYRAFNRCAKLKDFNLPANIETLGELCFQGTAVESIDIPVTLTTAEVPWNNVDIGPFNNCEKLKTVNFAADISDLPANLLAGSGVENVTLPNMITRVPASFFANCKSLTSVTIPDSVTSIDDHAFKGCTALETIKLPSGLTTLGELAFSTSGLTSVTIPKALKTALAPWNNVERGPFYRCDSLTDVTLENGITTVPAQLFAGSAAMEQIVIPKTVITIGELAFAGTGLTSVEIPNSVTTIDEKAFMNCGALTKVTLSKNLKSLGGRAFENTSISEIAIPKSLETVNTYWNNNYGPFRLCQNLKKVTLQEGSVKVANSLLAYAPAVEEITLPDTVVKIDDRAFDNCLALKKVNFGATVQEIGEFAFVGCNALESMEIPATVTSIDKKAFYSCSSLKEVTLPDSITYMGENAFGQTALEKVTMPRYLKEVPNMMCQDCINLTEVTMPEACTEVGGYVFDGCTSLTTVNFSDKEIIKEMGTNVFKDCTALTEFTLPMGLEKIGAGVFEGCSGLKKVVMADSINTMGSAVFKNCTSLTDVTLSRRLKAIPSETFRYDGELVKVKMPYSVKKIGKNAFGECISLKDIYVGKDVKEIDEVAFSYFEENVNGEPVTLYGTKGTYAEDYATVHSMKFAKNPYGDDSLGDYVRPGNKVDPPKPTEKKGDVSGDGALTVSDISLIAAHVKGIKPLK